ANSKSATFGPANLQLLPDSALLSHLRRIARAFPFPEAVTIGMAGARTASDRRRISDAAGRVWRNLPCVATNDLETALAAAELELGAVPRRTTLVLVLSGTGSCCYGRDASGRR